MANEHSAGAHGDNQLIEYRFEELKDDLREIKSGIDAGFADLKDRMDRLEGKASEMDIWRGKAESDMQHMDKRIETVENKVDEGGGSGVLGKVAVAAIGLAGTALGVIGTIVVGGSGA